MTRSSNFRFRITMRRECGINRHCIAIGIPYSALFPVKRGISQIRIPDSSSVSQCYRDTEFIPCSGLAGSGIECSGSGRAVVHQRDVWEGVLWGFVMTFSLEQALYTAASDHCGKILPPLVILAVEKLRGRTYLSWQPLASIISSS